MNTRTTELRNVNLFRVFLFDRGYNRAIGSYKLENIPD